MLTMEELLNMLNGLGQEIIILDFQNGAGLLDGSCSEKITVKDGHRPKPGVQADVEGDSDIAHCMNIGLAVVIHDHVGPQEAVAALQVEGPEKAAL